MKCSGKADIAVNVTDFWLHKREGSRQALLNLERQGV